MGSSIIHTSDVAGVEKKLTPISQFEMVEGMIADCLQQVKNSLDVLFFNPEKMDPTLNVLATRAITLTEIEGLGRSMEQGSLGLHPKHKMCLGMLQAMRKRLTHNAPMGPELGNMDIARFGRDMVDFLSGMHKVLSHGTDEKHRKTYYRDFMSGRRISQV